MDDFSWPEPRNLALAPTYAVDVPGKIYLRALSVLEMSSFFVNYNYSITKRSYLFPHVAVFGYSICVFSV